MKQKSNLLAANLKKRLDEQPKGNYRFVTLTLQHAPDADLATEIKRIYTFWKTLRQSDEWKFGAYKADAIRAAKDYRRSDPPLYRVKLAEANALPNRGQSGGAAIMEVKWSPSGGWHVHLHIVTEGGYIHQKDLSALWSKITKGSFKVDIRRLVHNKDVAYYVSKYVSKGVNAEVWDNVDARMEWIMATKGVRTCATFGTWRGYALLEKPTSATDWKPVGLLTRMAKDARAGDLAAIAALLSLAETSVYNPGRKRKQKRSD